MRGSVYLTQYLYRPHKNENQRTNETTEFYQKVPKYCNNKKNDETAKNEFKVSRSILTKVLKRKKKGFEN